MKTGNRKLGITLMSALLAATSSMAIASSHREAPGITKQPKVDGTDFYMFRSYEPGRADYVTFIANYIPVQAPYGGPNYFTMDEDAIYEIHIDNDGDAVEDITFQFDFANTLKNGTGIVLPVNGVDVAIPLRQSGAISAGDNSMQNERESFSLTHITADRRSGTRTAVTFPNGTAIFNKPIDNIGTKTINDYQTYANSFIQEIKIPGCGTNGKVFVGQRAEAFAVNLGPIFDLVNFVPLDGTQRPGGIINSPMNDDLNDANVTSLAIEVPIACVTGFGNGVIGAWTTSSLPQAQVRDPIDPAYGLDSIFGGAWVQQSRLSNPLVNEVVIGLPDKDRFNASEPMFDADPVRGFGQYVFTPVLPELLEALFGATAPNNFPRNDLAAAFLTGFAGVNQLATVTASEMLRLNTAVAPTSRANQSPFGVVAEDIAGYPNGRRPGDDVVDIALRVVMGRLCYTVPVGSELSGNPAIQGTPQDDVDLMLCDPADAPAGMEPFIDGAPTSATNLQNAFPYLNTPYPGAM